MTRGALPKRIGRRVRPEGKAGVKLPRAPGLRGFGTQDTREARSITSVVDLARG